MDRPIVRGLVGAPLGRFGPFRSRGRGSFPRPRPVRAGRFAPRRAGRERAFCRPSIYRLCPRARPAKLQLRSRNAHYRPLDGWANYVYPNFSPLAAA